MAELEAAARLDSAAVVSYEAALASDSAAMGKDRTAIGELLHSNDSLRTVLRDRPAPRGQPRALALGGPQLGVGLALIPVFGDSGFRFRKAGALTVTIPIRIRLGSILRAIF